MYLAGIDFTPEAFNEVTFAPTDANRSFLTVPITIMDDQVVESVEIFQLTATFQDPDSAQMVSSNPLLIGIDDNGDSMYCSTSWFIHSCHIKRLRISHFLMEGYREV